ncbi:hypothetical protein Tsubulata_013576 [Turnera subulata]|uniref:Nuclear cap-binding protein subunit 2 n=1 Tax=Turnera subulata TaxID=218843 RepID=A0A9Q0IWQ3_9ROSI|nr:hypothetical protein Tsubulata_013576 [Turnera subulata]
MNIPNFCPIFPINFTLPSLFLLLALTIQNPTRRLPPDAVEPRPPFLSAVSTSEPPHSAAGAADVRFTPQRKELHGVSLQGTFGYVEDQAKLSAYRDRKFPGTQDDFEHALLTSTTVYIGNMSFYTTEEQVYELFSRAGEIKKIIMGLDKNTKTPCGFCFVLFYSREDTEDAVKYISGTILDDRPIRVDFDWGFQEGRQWGRGRSGGQVLFLSQP